MSSDSVIRIPLWPEHFGRAELVVARSGGMVASAFRFDTDVAALRIRNEVGEIVLLPFQGQQIWDAVFRGRRLTMGSMFDQPYPTAEYLRNYGAFFLHCGATAMGNPGLTDTHPLHGELPNAAYRDAELVIGHDDGGVAYMELTGCYRHSVAFTHNYAARPSVRLRAGSGIVQLDMSIRNLKDGPMELMYLAHINFRPVDGAVLIDAVPDDPEHMRVRGVLPPATPSPEHARFLESVRADPAIHRVIKPGRRIEPELVIALRCGGGADGLARALQLLPDGTADYVGHRPSQLSHAVRWITRNGDQDAIGFVLPSTADADGYNAEKAKGNLLVLPPQGEFSVGLEFGALTAQEASATKATIEAERRQVGATR